MSFPIRICFSKTGYAKYISHLDMTRCVSRLFSRAGIPIWYTQGYNPHPYMVFCAALSVGTEGENELLDIKMDEVPDLAELIKKLNASAPKGFTFKEAYEPVTEFKDIVRASYCLTFSDEDAELFAQFLSTDELKVEKKTKRGTTTVDFKEEMTADCDGHTFYITLPCGVDRVISPNLLIDTFNTVCGKDVVPEVKRVEFFTESGEFFR